MAGSLGRRIVRTFFFNSLISLVVVVAFIWLIFEDMEDELLARDSREQLSLLQRDPYLAKNYFWQSDGMIVFFRPKDREGLEAPSVFSGLSSPYSGEIEQSGKIYQVFGYLTEEGEYFLAKDVSEFENREFLFGLMLGILCLVVVLLNFCLAVYSNRRLVKPLQRLTYQIRQAMPSHTFKVLDTHYSDAELIEIAGAFNWFSGEIATLIERERAMIGMASHELRTPIAIVSGALQVIEHRGKLTESDSKTFARIKKATREMEENVETLLTLSRRSRSSNPPDEIVVDVFLDGLIEEFGYVSQEDYQRISKSWQVAGVKLKTDPVLAKLLIRNLIRNALNHTKGSVQLALTDEYLDIVDQGPGLPADVQDWILNRIGSVPRQEGLGLYIVTLACEQLGWRLAMPDQSAGGTGIRLYFSMPSQPSTFLSGSSVSPAT